MGEFSDDEDAFADFDLDAAIASAQHDHKRAAPGALGAEVGKRGRTAEGEGAGAELLRADAVLLADEAAAVPARLQGAVTAALRRHFGHAELRPGQLTVLHALLGDDGTGRGARDACVFWATGAGKSLCYQLPPLYLNKVAIVVSPLISLMEDQVAKLNGRGGGDIATFLGSSQSDYGAEARALNGEYRLVYVTPEKLTGGDFLDGLAAMHRGGHEICLIAVDESHCVSEWGHDFRPAFLRLGPAIREHPGLGAIPLLALTATAVPRVQRDIVRNLRMRAPAVTRKSFDRPNLRISMRRKPRNGAHGAVEPIAQELARALVKQGGTDIAARPAGAADRSTIVYCATRKEVEDLAAKLIRALAHELVREHARLYPKTSLVFDAAAALAAAQVKPYHAGLAPAARTDAHTAFLVGRVAVIVATVAFGMGIDKPDIRRVVHWGACKTVEEYYQQMGRAGRDGRPAECVMYADAGDFVRYHDDFYLGGLKGEARAATVRSMDALRDFAMGSDGCRRASLLAFFEETPAFGSFCGTCDLCLNRKHHGDDLERDFQWEGARVVLFAVMACPNQAMSTIEIILKGGKVDSYKYNVELRDDPERVTKKINHTKEKMAKKKPLDYFKELLPSLVGSGYLKQDQRKSTHQYARPYSIYDLTAKGRRVLESGPIVLPVPATVRSQEKLEEEKRQKTLAELKDKGVDLDQIPQKELEEGDGEAIVALKRWYTYVDSLATRGRADLVDELDDLKQRIEAWRMDMAERFRMAPASVMEEHLLVKIAYAAASLSAGSCMDKEALVASGVRSNGIDELTVVLSEWADERKPKDEAGGTGGDMPMRFAPGQTFQAPNSWRFAVYKPNKKTGKAVWELSYDQFVNGTHPQTIAMTQKSGKPIQVATVTGHILDALLLGHAVDLHRLSLAEPTPTKNEWEELVRCSVETGIDVTGDPTTSGPNGERFVMKDFLLPIMGNSFVLKDYKERTPEESAKWNKWVTCLKWYLAFKKVGYEPSFGCGN